MNDTALKPNTAVITLPKPHSGQQAVINSKARFKVLMCGRRWGKTLICMVIAIKAMLAGKKVAYVTPEFGLGKQFFKDLLEYLPSEIIRVDNKSELYIELITGGSLKFFSGEAMDSFRGRKFHTVIIDEAAHIANLQEAWTQSIRATLTDYKGDAIFISTPRGKNYFYSLYLKGYNNEPDYQAWHFTSYDNPYIDETEIDAAKAELPEVAFNQEYLAMPGENQNNPIGSEYIELNTITTLSTKPTVVYGIDLAKKSDYTVILGLDAGGAMTYFQRFQKPWTLTYPEIQKLPANIPKAIDGTGVGDVVIERLKELGVINIKPFIFTSESKPKVIFELIKDIEEGKLMFTEQVVQELGTYEYKYSSTGHISFAAQSGFHDDTISALAVANHELKKHKAVTNWKLYSI